MRVPTIRAWLRECDENHDGCVHSRSRAIPFRLPQRFLDVHQGGIGTKSDSVRLVLTSGKDFTKETRYIALSHCWGKGGVKLKATTDNANSLMENISLADLPNTFQHAAIISRELGIQYLWVDSLCIIQDDAADWQREAAKMASIFHHAFLTLSATAQDGDGGCGLSKFIPPARQFFWAGDTSTPAFAVRTSPNYTIWRPKTHFQNWPLNSRGWIFQEILLSRRILHIDENGFFFWQCATLLESEDGTLLCQNSTSETPISASLLEGPLQPPDPTVTSTLWWWWLTDFFRRSFTVPDDALPAISGAITYYQTLTGDKPVLGFWRKFLPQHLSWVIKDSAAIAGRDFRRNAKHPSWSWTSFSHPDLVHLYPSLNAQIAGVAWEVGDIGFDVKWESLPYVSPLVRAALFVKRFRIPSKWADDAPDCSLHWDSAAAERYTHAFRDIHKHVGDYRMPDHHGAFAGTGTEMDAMIGMWLLRQDYLVLSVTKKAEINLLVLEPVGKDKYPFQRYRQYRRLGFATLSWGHKVVGANTHANWEPLSQELARDLKLVDTIKLI